MPCFTKTPEAKNLWIREGGSFKTFNRKFFVSQCRKFHTGTFYCFTNYGYRKSLDKKAGASRSSVENFLSQSAEKFRRAILQCCNNFGYRKSLDKKGGHQDFPSKIFCLTVPKNFVGQSFSVAIISGIEKVWIRRGGIKIFRRKFFVSQCRKIP